MTLSDFPITTHLITEWISNNPDKSIDTLRFSISTDNVLVTIQSGSSSTSGLFPHQWEQLMAGSELNAECGAENIDTAMKKLTSRLSWPLKAQREAYVVRF